MWDYHRSIRIQICVTVSESIQLKHNRKITFESQDSGPVHLGISEVISDESLCQSGHHKSEPKQFYRRFNRYSLSRWKNQMCPHHMCHFSATRLETIILFHWYITMVTYSIQIQLLLTHMKAQSDLYTSSLPNKTLQRKWKDLSLTPWAASSPSFHRTMMRLTFSY